MLGFDFSVFWDTGRAILDGRDPYSVHLSAYPPAMAYFYTLFALIPFALAFPIWCGANILFLVDALRRRGLVKQLPAWLLSAPSLFIILTGQIDLFFFWLSGMLAAGGWAGALAAALVTLKPQVAIVVLPWHLLAWLRRDRIQLLRWGGLCLLLHSFPLLFDPTIYARWVAAVASQPGWRASISSGVFLFANLGIPIWVLAIPAAALLIWGLTRDEPTARAALLLAQPIGVWYEDVLLVGSVTWKLFLPLSLLAFLLAALFQNSLPLLLIPSGVLVWRLSKSRQEA